MAKSVDAPARYRAFLSALRRTANAELAFAQSGVNRSWAYWRRKRDADFAADWAAAAAAGRERLGLRPPVKPTWDGVPLVLTGRFTSRERRLRQTLRLHIPERRARWKRQQMPELPSIEQVQAEIAQVLKVIRAGEERKRRRSARDAR